MFQKKKKKKKKKTEGALIKACSPISSNAVLHIVPANWLLFDTENTYYSCEMVLLGLAKYTPIYIRNTYV